MKQPPENIHCFPLVATCFVQQNGLLFTRFFSFILIESNCELDLIESDQEGLCMFLGLVMKCLSYLAVNKSEECSRKGFPYLALLNLANEAVYNVVMSV
jgi:hypothetical protein